MLRWAVLGTGFISNTVIEAIALSDQSRVDVIAGRHPAKVTDFQQRHNIARGATFDEAIADADIDAIYIGLPNHQHHPYAIAAAQAGKAVLSEKSITTTVESARELLAAATEHQTFFVEGLMYLSHPLYDTVATVLADGRLGRLRSISARYGADIGHLVNPAGRGTIYNLGCYPVSLMHFVVQTMLGEEAFSNRSMAATGITHDEDGTITDAALLVRFDDGVLATIQSSDTYGNTSDFSIAGDNGVLSFETNPWLPAAGDNTLTWLPHDGPAERITITDPHDAFYHQIKMVERHVERGDIEASRPAPRWKDSLEIIELLTAWEQACLES